MKSQIIDPVPAFRAVLFDFDYTLADSSQGAIECINFALAEMGLARVSRPRLHDPEDFVNLEISIALQRKIRVIPVLVQGTSMPRTQDLPESLSLLSRRNALDLSDSRWRSDVAELIKVLEKYL